MKINEEVIKKIHMEEKKYLFGREFGGFLLVEQDEIKDVIFDVEKSNQGHVTFGYENVFKLPSEKKKIVKGWFHKHGINNLSDLDKRTTAQLTKLWGICYALILQRNKKLLLIKTIHTKEFVSGFPVVIEIERIEVEYAPVESKKEEIEKKGQDVQISQQKEPEIKKSEENNVSEERNITKGTV